jgi:hypothetical protein
MRYVHAAICLVAGAVLAVSALAQEGHPLEGFWHGEIGSGAAKKPITLLLKWENRMIRGSINPGVNPMPLKIATLEPKGWKVHLEAESRDAKGATTPVVIDAEIQDIGKYKRSLVGTITQGGVKSDFKATRD